MRRIKRMCFAIAMVLIASLSISCSTTKTPKLKHPYEPRQLVSYLGNGYLLDRTPKQFLEEMKRHPGELNVVTFGTDANRQGVRGWVREEDLPYLMSQVDSTEPSGGWMMDVSSIWPTHVTVGDVARSLVLAYRVDAFPPELNCQGGPTAEELHKWWNEKQRAWADAILEKTPNARWLVQLRNGKEILALRIDAGEGDSFLMVVVANGGTLRTPNSDIDSIRPIPLPGDPATVPFPSRDSTTGGAGTEPVSSHP